MGSPEAEDMYSISKPGEDKRILVLLNVHTFEDDRKKQMYRPTQQDTKSMQSTFRNLGFDVETFTETDHISKQEATETIRKALKTIDQDPDSYSCFALCIMTHGQWVASDAPKHKDDLKDIFCFSDHQFLTMDSIVSLVSGCEGLKGKPKLFFMQACRGKRLFGSHRLKEAGEDVVDKANLVKKERDTVDGQELRRADLHPQRAARVPLFPDCLISWATSPDYVSFKSSEGAPYIDHLCSTLEDYHDKLDLLTMVTIANGRVAETYATHNDEIDEYDIQFQKVHPSSQETLVYSAFYDPRLNPSAIRIVGMSSGESSMSQVGIKKYCQIWYVDRTQPEISSAEYQIIPETHERKYAISVHLCYLRRHPTNVPYAVSLVMQKCAEPHHMLKVNYHSYDKPPERNYTVCITPLNMNYNKTNEFLDIMEANKMFGAQKFVLYNYSSAAELQPYLKSYIDEGLAEVHPWKVPVPVDTWPPDPHSVPQVHYFAQLGALTDCMYRHMFSSKYILFSDLDELLVPQMENHATWDDMWKSIEVAPQVGEWIFQSAFFRMDWADDQDAKRDPDVKELGLITQLKTLREEHSFPHFSRSKYILNPRMVEMIGVHYAFDFLNDSPLSQILVPDSVALLHHYRLWEDGDSAPSRKRSTAMHRFSRKIISAVRDRREKVKKYK